MGKRLNPHCGGAERWARLRRRVLALTGTCKRGLMHWCRSYQLISRWWREPLSWQLAHECGGRPGTSRAPTQNRVLQKPSRVIFSTWIEVARFVCVQMPFSAMTERVFSTMKRLFGDLQAKTYMDYVEMAVRSNMADTAFEILKELKQLHDDHAGSSRAKNLAKLCMMTSSMAEA